MKKIITIKGEINPDDAGIILPHEHLLIDVRCWKHSLPRELSKAKEFTEKVSIENRGEVVYNCFYFEDNLFQEDVQIAISESKKFRDLGGGTIVDVTLPAIGRDPEALYKISNHTGLNIVMGAGYYVSSSWSKDDINKSESQLANEIINDFIKGVGLLGVKAGVIGEVGISDINNPLEIKSLKASAIAQKELKCGMIIHPPVWEKNGNDILNILEKKKVNLEKVVLSHCGPTLDDIDYHDSLAKRGVFIAYDQFGMELMAPEGKFFPSDGEGINSICSLIEKGNIDNILISHDICFKILLTKWGGWGYGHILKHIIPRMLDAGISNEEIFKIIKENPKKLLTINI